MFLLVPSVPIVAMEDTENSELLPDGNTDVLVLPHVVDSVLSTSSYGPTLGQIEEHVLRSLLGVQNHKHHTVG